jgi:hypothetical protein
VYRKQKRTKKEQNKRKHSINKPSLHKPSATSSVPLAIQFPHTPHSLHLQVRVTLIAHIHRIIHVVMDRIRLTTGLLIQTALLRRNRGTPIRCSALYRRVIDVITGTIATVAFKGLQKPEPVARLMDGGLVLVVAVHGAGWHRIGVDIASVVEVDGVVGRAICDAGGERAAAEHAAGEVGL